METLESYIWIVLALACLIYLVYRNRRLSRILNDTLRTIDESKRKCETLLAEIQKCPEEKIQQSMITQLLEEERRITDLFADEKRWKGQAKRIREHKETISKYIKTAKDILWEHQRTDLR